MYMHIKDSLRKYDLIPKYSRLDWLAGLLGIKRFTDYRFD